ncbi:UDP-N-acetylmuramoyl-tripeptide--D-alanyl-D-alanine ligase [Brevibacillus composti]|nr:UDP-N-acetylmuramoyl-tripeptide--D-alanyl-D-alanine ligase [Brevibacillus composti]
MKRKPIIIAVTGSAGKTTTKEMIASILRRKWPVYKSPANRNLMVHTRAHARRIRPTHKAAVLEYRIPRRGNLRQHCRIFQPSIGIITNIGTAHLGHFGGSQRRLAMAKSELIRHMKPHGIIFLNADCPYTRQFGKQPYRGRFRGRIITVGIKRRAMYAARNIRHTPSGLTFTCVLNGVNVSFSIPIPGTHNIINALLAIAVCHQLGLAAQDIQSGLLNYPRPKRRLTVTRHRHQITVIDDTYSANPSAVMAALNVLRQIGAGLDAGARQVYAKGTRSRRPLRLEKTPSRTLSPRPFHEIYVPGGHPLRPLQKEGQILQEPSAASPVIGQKPDAPLHHPRERLTPASHESNLPIFAKARQPYARRAGPEPVPIYHAEGSAPFMENVHASSGFTPQEADYSAPLSTEPDFVPAVELLPDETNETSP